MVKVNDVFSLMSSIGKEMKKRNFGKGHLFLEVDSVSFDTIDRDLYEMHLNHMETFTPSEKTIDIESDFCGVTLVKKEFSVEGGEKK